MNPQLQLNLAPAGRMALALEFDTESLKGAGAVTPRLTLEARATHPIEGTQVVPLQLDCQLFLWRPSSATETELLGTGTGFVEGGSVLPGPGAKAVFTFMLSPPALDYIEDNSPEGPIALNVVVRGTVGLYGGDQALQTALGGSVWPVAPTGGHCTIKFHRSAWWEKVSDPLRNRSTIFLPVPLGDLSEDEDLARALKYLREADSDFAHGRDASVLANCYKVMGRLGEDPKTIFSRVPQANKRDALDLLMMKCKALTDLGRHDELPRNSDGYEPDHLDARLVLVLTHAWVSYVANLRLNLPPLPALVRSDAAG